MALSALAKGPTVLGAQRPRLPVSPLTNNHLTELVALDAGRRGHLRSQNRGGIFI